MKLEEFKHFLLAYFNQSYDYSDLSNLAKEYRYRSSNKEAEMFLKELSFLTQQDDWSFIGSYVSEHGMRTLNKKKLKTMIDIIIKELTDENFDKDKYEPFF